MGLFKAFSALSFALLIGCAHPATTEAPVAKPAPAVPSDPTLVSGETWTINLSEPLAWERKEGKKSGNVRTEAIFVSKLKFGGQPVVLAVHTAPVEVGQTNIEFIENFVNDQHQRHDIKFIALMEVEIASGEVGALAAQARTLSQGQSGVFELVTASSTMAYVVSCVGKLDSIQDYEELCLGTMQTFTIKQ